jgi:hypothetical protein
MPLAGRFLGLSLLAGASLLVAGRARAATQVLAPSDDTFINQGHLGNNNGASLSIFTGTDGHNGNMRGLIRFGMPAGLQGRVTVTGVQLTMTVQELGDGTSGTPAIESLQAVTEAWAQGNGIGNSVMSFTVGQPCGGPVSGATWNQPNCALPAGWATPGGTVVAAVSAQADTTGVPTGGQVVWSSASGPQLNADIQGWIDNPTSNHGWRITSSTEDNGGRAQRFVSSEAGATPPTLAVTYSCNPGFVASGNDCVAAPTVPALGAPALGLLALLLAAGFVARARRSRA